MTDSSACVALGPVRITRTAVPQPTASSLGQHRRGAPQPLSGEILASVDSMATRPSRGPSPLWRRAPTRLLHSGAWGVLVVAAFLLLTSAAAAAPIFTAAARNASLALTLRAVPATALASESAVVRLNGGRTPTADRQRGLLADLARVPGLTRPVVSGGSVGNELAGHESYADGFVGVNGHAVPARLYGPDDLGAALVPAPGSPSVSAAGDGVWLPR